MKRECGYITGDVYFITTDEGDILDNEKRIDDVLDGVHLRHPSVYN